ncbi:unnamed protein product [Trichobilharzia szidati]|nr:unnamed protein product [Trichobilharzia szidati]
MSYYERLELFAPAFPCYCTAIRPPPPSHPSGIIHGGQYISKQSPHQPFYVSARITTNGSSLIGQSSGAQASSPQISPQSIAVTDSNIALPSPFAKSQLTLLQTERSPRATQETTAQLDSQPSQPVTI